MDDRFIVGTGLVAGSGLRRAQLITTGRPPKVAENSQKTQSIEISRSGRVERVQIPGVLRAGEKRGTRQGSRARERRGRGKRRFSVGCKLPPAPPLHQSAPAADARLIYRFLWPFYLLLLPFSSSPLPSPHPRPARRLFHFPPGAPPVIIVSTIRPIQHAFLR